MKLADDFSEEEKKYFDSRGETDLNTDSEEANESTEAADSMDDGESEEIYTADEKANTDPETANDTPKQEPEKEDRDFKKAYAVAEEKRIEARRLFEEQKQKTSEMERRLSEITAYLQQQHQQNQHQNIPNKDDDPIAYQAYEIDQLKKQYQQQQQYIEYQNQRNQQQSATTKAINRYVDEARQYAETQPMFGEAYKFLEQSRMKELMAAGYDMNQSSRLLQEDELAIAAKAFQDGVNPGERIYAAALARGFNPTSNIPTQHSKLEAVKKGMKNSKNLSNAGSRNLSRELDFSNIDKMSAEEFDKFFEKVKKEQDDGYSMFF